MRRISFPTPDQLHRKAIAWFVHLFTASGAIWGLFAIISIYEQNWKLSFIWIVVAMVVDGLDGTLARRARVHEFAPGLDGALLDNIIDFLNYAIVPALFIFQTGLLPPQYNLVAACTILFASAYQFCQMEAKTQDNYFTGFPSYWNVVVIYLFIARLNPWINFSLILFLGVLAFTPIKYIYPSRMNNHRNLTVSLTYLWALFGFIGLMMYPDIPRWMLWTSFIYVAYYLGLSLFPLLKRSIRLTETR